MQLEEFTVHDVSNFPEVRCDSNRIYSGYGPQWRDELEALIARAEPFYMVFDANGFEESQEDTRLRAKWLKENKSLLATVCKCIVSIEPNAEERERQNALSAGLERAFGVTRRVVADRQEATSVGHSLLK
ncbi:hypothetical protein [Paraburkholderia tropica]|uniref:hypothetical protein n=1 Tax=Paraburkholderia tropica TaxID=92647 RepID=UPI0007EC7023|nr:hypothetical protein [Paraburkholderia tropica]OBR53125.1 hypothetical protein A6456_09180 [Paraburkholderia tropica]